MALKKSELYSSIWASCDELRGGIDASQYKDYVLVLLFVKYVSDRYAGHQDALVIVPPGGSFQDMVAAHGQPDIGDRMNKIVARLAEANNLTGVIDVADFNAQDKLGRGQEMVDRLSNLVAIFNAPALDFSKNRADGDDLLGDAYEYLMRNFATESGRSKGQFYTPAEVSRVIAKVIGIDTATRSNQTIYDPTCGSGSLLLKVHDEARGARDLDLTIYGQEMDNTTYALARMNMILHDCPTADIWRDNTLARPYFKEPNGQLKTFDFAVANPPFSFKAWTTGFDPSHDLHHRFDIGQPPAKNGDYAFLLHILASLKSTGKAVVVMPHGVLFRGGAEGDIRRQLVRRGYIKGIIGLPANLFYGTGIPACLVILDKENAAGRTGIFFLDASHGFLKDGAKNRLRAQDIHKIVDTFTRVVEIPRYSRLVPLAEIEANDFNLNIPRYIDSSEPEDLQDIEAHLHGGIPNRDLDALAAYWQVFPTLRDTLFEPAGRPGYSSLRVPPAEVKSAILNHPEFAAFKSAVAARFDQWQAQALPCLMSIGPDDHPKALIHELSESLLAAFRDTPLIDAYDVYQHLMDYWDETMQDDVYLIVTEGWQGAAKLRPLVPDKQGKVKETPGLVIGKQKFKADLIPPALLIARYFPDQQAAIDQLTAEADALTQELDDLAEEHGGEEGFLAEVIDDKGKITKVLLIARLKEMRTTPAAAEELTLLTRCEALIDQQMSASKEAKDRQKAFDEAVIAQYLKLTPAEINHLVVKRKWLHALAAALTARSLGVSERPAARIAELARRYGTSLPALTSELSSIGSRVQAHLTEMAKSHNLSLSA